jgi:hypothetical protein
MAPPVNQAATEKTNINLEQRKKQVYSTQKVFTDDEISWFAIGQP